jgi:hypothetical protein
MSSTKAITTALRRTRKARSSNRSSPYLGEGAACSLQAPRPCLALSLTNPADRLLFDWLRLVEPTGWTSTAEMPNVPVAVDLVQSLCEPEELLWNEELCPGAPCRGYSCVLENAVYRLMVLGVLDPQYRELAMRGFLPRHQNLEAR